MRNLDNQTNEIRIYYRKWFPELNKNCTRVPTFHPSVYCPYPGMMVEMMELLAKKAGLRIIQVESEEDDKDHLGFNTQNQLIKKVYDMEATTWQITDERLKFFDFTESLYLAKTTLIRRRNTGKLTDIFGFFHAYDIKIWLIIFGIGLIQWMCCVLSQKLNSIKTKRPKQSFVDVAWQVLRLQLLQPSDRTQHQMDTGYRLSMSIFSFFQCYVLLTLFSSSILVTLLKIPHRTANAFDFLIESVGRGEYKFAGVTNTNWLFDNINHSNAYPYQQIKHALEINPFHFTRNTYETMQTAAKDGKTIIFQQTDELGYFLAQQYCELIYLEEGMPVVGAHLMLLKGHPLLGRLNDAIKYSQTHIHAIRRKYNKLRCKFNKCTGKKRFKPLKITPYLGALVICSCILLVGVLALFVEFACFYVKKHSRAVNWSE